jgi:phage terminase small subunit
VKLSPRKQRFVEEYLVDLNATKAAERAGYSARTAKAQGSRLLTNVDVSAAIEVAQSKRSERTEITADRVLREIALVAFSDIGEVIRVDADGKVYIRELESLPVSARRSIAEVTQTTTERTEHGEKSATIEKIQLGVKFHSKVAGLKLLADHLGLSAAKKHEHTGKDGEAIPVRVTVTPEQALAELREELEDNPELRRKLVGE